MHFVAARDRAGVLGARLTMGKRNADQVRRIRAGTSRAMKARAEARRCPSCGRGAAMKRIEGVGSVCRWCKHERRFADDRGDADKSEE